MLPMLQRTHWILHRQIHASKVESTSGKEEESSAKAEVMLKGSGSMAGRWGSRLKGFLRVWRWFLHFQGAHIYGDLIKQEAGPPNP